MASAELCSATAIWKYRRKLLWEQSLLQQWGNTDEAPVGAVTAAASEKRKWLVQKRVVLRQCKRDIKAPAGAVTATASKKKK